MRERLDVLDRHVIAPVHQRARLAAEDQRLRGAEPGAPLHPFLDELERAAAVRAATRPPAGPRSARPPRRRAPAAPAAGTRGCRGRSSTRSGVRLHRARRLRHDPHFVVFAQVGHDDVEHEAIELRLGQRIGAFELDRVLRRQHEERPLELIRSAGGRDVILLHRFEQRRLRLRRRPVDLVGQDDLREDRSLARTAACALPCVLVEDLGARDVGRHQVGRELDPLEARGRESRRAS